jgi:hypothetical protein
MKLRIISAAALALSVGAALPAQAAAIFADDFNRANSNTVGNGWAETEPQPSDIRVHGNVLELVDEGSKILQAGGISTVGFTGITLSYDWSTIGNTESDDFLVVEWRDASQAVESWTALLPSDPLGGSPGFSHSSFALGAAAENLADLEIRFSVDVDGNNEGVLLDNVVLAGTPVAQEISPQQQVPEPGSLALAGLGVVLLALRRRDKRA